jgi:hypothetical protein
MSNVRVGFLVMFIASCGGSQAPRSALVDLQKRAPDEWFQAFRAGAPKYGCELTDKSEPGYRTLFAKCPSKQASIVLLDTNNSTTAVMCDPLGSGRVTDEQCATLGDEIMQAGRKP